MLELILGGARSGKSRYAEQRAHGDDRVYIATATAGDGEMAERIARHRLDRGPHWRTVEAPITLAPVLRAQTAPGRFVLVDCLTLWLTNLLLSEDASAFARERAALLQWLPEHQGHLVFVSNEVGQGVVPADALSRRFVDESGRLHQELAQHCDRVVFVTAGLPHALKDQSA
ncbi:MAG: bifunctional adenosylcobinamide kinase/adenosylcobinamide-phosphate guanylyltransferase [Spongiibacteraceae bacterium]